MSWRLPPGWPQGEVPPDLLRFGLGPRLARIAMMVGTGRAMVDVGTDHGLLPIALVGSGRCTRAVGIDRADAPLAVAAGNRARFGVQVELRLGSGVPFGAEVAVIAGMGGRAIAEMVRGAVVERFVVQANSEVELVRRALAAAGYRSAEERFVADGGRFFLVIAADRGEGRREISLEEAFIGGVREDPLFEAWCELQRAHWRRRRDRSAEERLTLLGKG